MFKLCAENVIGGTCVGLCRVGIVKVAVAVELHGGRERALLHLVEDVLHIHQAALAYVKVGTCAGKFLYEQRHVVGIGVEACKVALAEACCQLGGTRLEARTFRHVGIVYAVDGRGLLGDVAARVESQRFALLRAVGEHFYVGQLDDTILSDIEASGLNVEEDDGSCQS